nr:hypothetical protein CFP56_12977 [Quercus suber]
MQGLDSDGPPSQVTNVFHLQRFPSKEELATVNLLAPNCNQSVYPRSLIKTAFVSSISEVYSGTRETCAQGRGPPFSISHLPIRAQSWCEMDLANMDGAYEFFIDVKKDGQQRNSDCNTYLHWTTVEDSAMTPRNSHRGEKKKFSVACGEGDICGGICRTDKSGILVNPGSEDYIGYSYMEDWKSPPPSRDKMLRSFTMLSFLNIQLASCSTMSSQYLWHVNFPTNLCAGCGKREIVSICTTTSNVRFGAFQATAQRIYHATCIACRTMLVIASMKCLRVISST